MNVSINKVEGTSLITQFVLKEENVSQIILKNTWDTGDGTKFHDVSSITHTYKSPGVYDVYYKSIDISGTVTEFKKSILVKSPIYDSIIFTQIPEFYGDPGKPSGVFKVALTSSNITEDIYVDLHAANSKSLPLQFAKPSYENITPTWCFTLSDNTSTIENIKVNTIPITAIADDGTSVMYGVTGEVAFRFRDDVATGVPEYEKPILLTATLRTSAFTYYKDSSYINFDSYSNSKVKSATIAWQTNYLPVGSLRILQDDLNIKKGINKLNWTNSKIPFIVTARNATTSYATSSEQEGINFSYPDTTSNDIFPDINKTFITILTSLTKE